MEVDSISQTEKDKYNVTSCVWNLETGENTRGNTEAGDWGQMNEGGPKVQNSSYEIHESWDVQRGDCS